MAGDSPDAWDQMPLDAVLDALDDPDCRAIVRHLTEPMNAKEIAETTDVPKSTTYRKLDALSEAGLVAESTELRDDGHHTARYELDFEAVVIARESDNHLFARVYRESRSAEQRLADMWSEVRKEL